MSRNKISRAVKRSVSCLKKWSIDCDRPSEKAKSTHKLIRYISGRNVSLRYGGYHIPPRQWILPPVRPILMLRLRVGPNSPSNLIKHCMTSSSSMRLLRAGNAVNFWSWVRRSGLWWMHQSKKCNSPPTISKLTGKKQTSIGSHPLLTFSTLDFKQCGNPITGLKQ